jgi:hypothetical protein
VKEERLIEYGCECGAAECSATVLMTFSERDTVVDAVVERIKQVLPVLPVTLKPPERFTRRFVFHDEADLREVRRLNVVDDL